MFKEIFQGKLKTRYSWNNITRFPRLKFVRLRMWWLIMIQQADQGEVRPWKARRTSLLQEGSCPRDCTEAFKAPILRRGSDDQLTRNSEYQEIGYEGRSKATRGSIFPGLGESCASEHRQTCYHRPRGAKGTRGRVGAWELWCRYSEKHVKTEFSMRCIFNYKNSSENSSFSPQKKKKNNWR